MSVFNLVDNFNISLAETSNHEITPGFHQLSPRTSRACILEDVYIDGKEWGRGLAVVVVFFVFFLGGGRNVYFFGALFVLFFGAFSLHLFFVSGRGG